MAHTDADNSSTGGAGSTAGQEQDVGPIHASQLAADVAVEHFGRHFASSPQPMVLFGADFRVLAVNEAVQRLAGQDSAESWVGRNIGDDFLTFNDADHVVASVVELFEGRTEHFDFECELTTLRGQHKSLRIAMQALRAPDGSISYMAGFVSDVTDSLVRVLGKQPEHIHIVIDEVAEENWGYAGMLTDDWKKTKDRQ